MKLSKDEIAAAVMTAMPHRNMHWPEAYRIAQAAMDRAAHPERSAPDAELLALVTAITQKNPAPSRGPG